jgi:hypothetical protein
MPEPLALGTARILVTNDDGIHAPGLKALGRPAIPSPCAARCARANWGRAAMPWTERQPTAC